MAPVALVERAEPAVRAVWAVKEDERITLAEIGLALVALVAMAVEAVMVVTVAVVRAAPALA